MTNEFRFGLWKVLKILAIKYFIVSDASWNLKKSKEEAADSAPALTAVCLHWLQVFLHSFFKCAHGYHLHYLLICFQFAITLRSGSQDFLCRHCVSFSAFPPVASSIGSIWNRKLGIDVPKRHNGTNIWERNQLGARMRPPDKPATDRCKTIKLLHSWIWIQRNIPLFTSAADRMFAKCSPSAGSPGHCQMCARSSDGHRQ